MAFYTLPYNGSTCCSTCPTVQSCTCATGLCPSNSCFAPGGLPPAQAAAVLDLGTFGTLSVPSSGGGFNLASWFLHMSGGTSVTIAVSCGSTAHTIQIVIHFLCGGTDTEWFLIVPDTALTCDSGTNHLNGTITITTAPLVSACNPNICFCAGDVGVVPTTSFISVTFGP